LTRLEFGFSYTLSGVERRLLCFSPNPLKSLPSREDNGCRIGTTGWRVTRTPSPCLRGLHANTAPPPETRMTWRRLTPIFLALGLAACTRGPAPHAAAALAQDKPNAPKAPPTGQREAAPSPPGPAAKVDSDGLLAKAEAMLKASNASAALPLLDEVIKADPTNRRALGLVALGAQDLAGKIQRPQSSRYFLESADALRRLVELKAELTPDEKRLAPVILYNEACTLAIQGETARALRALVACFDTGFTRVDLFDTDPELDSLRILPGFQEFQRKAEQRHTELLLSLTQPFAIDFRLPDVDGKNIALADVKGELTLINFWGTWCAPCRKEVPHLVELAVRYHDKGVRVVGLNYELSGDADPRKTVRAFVKDRGITYPCLMGDTPTRDKVPRFQGYPTTLFVDRQGMVRLHVLGYQSLETLEIMVNTLLDEAKPRPKGEPLAKPANKAASP
jgi:thiol-disulfide isomerase/thioredoxin